MVSLRFLVVGVALITPSIASIEDQYGIAKVFRGLQTKVEELESIAKSINSANALLQPAGAGPFPQLFDGFSEVVSIMHNKIKPALSGPPVDYSPEDEFAVENSYSDFIGNTHGLAKVLMDKVSVLQAAPIVGPPMVKALREVKIAYEAVGPAGAASFPDRSIYWTFPSQRISMKLNSVIKAYEELTPLKP